MRTPLQSVYVFFLMEEEDEMIDFPEHNYVSENVPNYNVGDFVILEKDGDTPGNSFIIKEIWHEVASCGNKVKRRIDIYLEDS